MDASCAYTLPDNMAPLVGTVFVNKLIERYACVHTFAAISFPDCPQLHKFFWG